MIHSQWTARRHDQRADSRTPTQQIHIHARSAHRLEKLLMRLSLRVEHQAHPQHQCTRHGHTPTTGAQASSAQSHELFSRSRQRESECTAHHLNPPAVGSRPIIRQIPAVPHLQISNTLPLKTKHNYDRMQRHATLEFRTINAYTQSLFITSPIIFIDTTVHNKSNTP
jgi:hypothetical protein